ncbi:MAG TPA: ABC transporter ATP-binding protein [Xanthobacteraceae bacterium]|nr:ABC transporter ATP-binding protein [Xanthobacteraceae bacterium]
MTTGSPSPALLEVRGLASGYGRIPILHGVALQVAAGERVGILGHNGMGKSTLLRTLTGHLPATAGTLQFAGTDVTRASPTTRARLGIGYVPQGREIFPALSVRDNLRVGCRLSKRPEAESLETILELFPRLKTYLDRRGGALSGGEQQLLALARCLCGDPRIVLLDEPTEGIQPSIIDEIADTLKIAAARRGLAILLVEQNLGFIASVSQRILILQKGEITREIPAEALGDIERLEAYAELA